MPCYKLRFQYIPSLRSNGTLYEAVHVTYTDANDFLEHTRPSPKSRPDEDDFATLTRCLVESGAPEWVTTAKMVPDEEGFYWLRKPSDA